MRDQQLAFRTNKRKRNQSAVFSPSLALALISISHSPLWQPAGFSVSLFFFCPLTLFCNFIAGWPKHVSMPNVITVMM